MPHRRHRNAVAAEATANENDPDESEVEWCIIAPGSSETYFGMSGEINPTFSICEPFSCLELFPEALFDSNSPFPLRKFGEHLKGKPLVICVPATCSDSSRLRLCQSFFQMTQCTRICLLSEAVSCSFVCGRTEGVTIFDFGWSHATASFVEQGRTTKFVSSSSMALKKFFEQYQNNNNNNNATTVTVTAAEETPFSQNNSEICSWYSSSSHIESMAMKMPLRALQDYPILLVGGGGGCNGLGTAISKVLKSAVSKILTEDESESEESSSSDSEEEEENDNDADDDETISKKKKRKKKAKKSLENIPVSSVIRIPSVASRLLVFRGASLVASAGVLEESSEASISREEWKNTINNNMMSAGGETQREKFLQMIRWRFPM